jgi:drug/metabolite transporter (DMT)-like permease
MLVQIALLAWIFLGEQITFYGLIGLILAAFGVLLVNLQSA